MKHKKKKEKEWRQRKIKRKQFQKKKKMLARSTVEKRRMEAQARRNRKIRKGETLELHKASAYTSSITSCGVRIFRGSFSACADSTCGPLRTKRSKIQKFDPSIACNAIHSFKSDPLSPSQRPDAQNVSRTLPTTAIKWTISGNSGKWSSNDVSDLATMTS